MKKKLSKKQLILYVKLYQPTFDKKNLERMNTENLKILLNMSEDRYLKNSLNIKN